MANTFLTCACGEVMFKGLDSEVKIRNKVIIVRDSAVFAVCKGCDTEIQVPLQLDVGLAKSLNERTGPKLYLKPQK